MNSDKLTAEVTQELDQLRRVAEHAAELAKVPAEDRRPWHAAAAAKYAADLVNGLENLCKRRYRSANLPVPEGEDSHTRILEEFIAAPELGAGLTDEVKHRLRKYLRFRHRFVHGYGHDEVWFHWLKQTNQH